GLVFEGFDVGLAELRLVHLDVSVGLAALVRAILDALLDALVERIGGRAVHLGIAAFLLGLILSSTPHSLVELGLLLLVERRDGSIVFELGREMGAATFHIRAIDDGGYFFPIRIFQLTRIILEL